MSNKPLTRAHYYSVKPAKIKRATQNHIMQIKFRLDQILKSWGDVDQGFLNSVEAVISQVEVMEEDLDEAINLLKEPIE